MPVDNQRVLDLERLKGDVRWGGAVFGQALGQLSVYDERLRGHLQEREQAIYAEVESTISHIDALIDRLLRSG